MRPFTSDSHLFTVTFTNHERRCVVHSHPTHTFHGYIHKSRTPVRRDSHTTVRKPAERPAQHKTVTRAGFTGASSRVASRRRTEKDRDGLRHSSRFRSAKPSDPPPPPRQRVHALLKLGHPPGPVQRNSKVNCSVSKTVSVSPPSQKLLYKAKPDTRCC